MDGSFPSQRGAGFDGGYGAHRGGGRGGFRGNEMNAKTRICMRWQAGDCRFGDNCNFAHGEAELRTLPPRQGGGRGRYDDRGPPGGGGGYYQGAGVGPPGGMGGYGDQYGRPQNGGYGGPPGGGYGGPPGAYGGGGPGPMGGPPPGSAAEAEWAAQGYPVQGPGDWVQYQTQDTHEPYYHNHRTGETIWDKPPGWH